MRNGAIDNKETWRIHLRRSLFNLFEHAKTHERLFTIVVATCIGILCGFGAVGFRYLIEAFHRFFWGHWHLTLDVLIQAPAWRILLIPALGGLIVGFLCPRSSRAWRARSDECGGTKKWSDSCSRSYR